MVRLTSMPRPSNPIPNLPPLLAIRHRDDIANYLVPGHNRERIAKLAGLHGGIGVADAAGDDLHEDLAWAGLLEGDLLDGEGRVDALEDGGLVGFREGRHVCNHSLRSGFQGVHRFRFWKIARVCVGGLEWCCFVGVFVGVEWFLLCEFEE